MARRSMWTGFVCCAVSAFAGHAACADDTSYETVGEVLKITVPAGSTNEVDVVELAPLLSNTVTSVEKYGPGSIVISTDITGFEGDIRVKEGVWRVVDSKGLGKLSSDSLAEDVGKVYVSEGATLESKCTESPKYMGKQIHVSGYGVDGNGALQVSGDVNCGSSTWGSNLILEGDTYASSVTAAYWCFNLGGHHKDGYLTFNGHDFIVSGGTGKNPYVVLSNVNNTDLGRIVLTNGTILSFQGVNNLRAVDGETGTIVVNPNCSIKGNKWTGRVEWDVIWNTERYLTPDPYSTTDAPVTNKCSLHGGVYVESRLNATISNGGGFGLFGPVSGQGRIYVESHNSVPPTNRLWIANSGNTFSGDVVCKNVRIMLPVDGALPMTTSLRMTDCSIGFSGVNYTLPDATLTNVKDCVISGGQGRWTRFEKGGTGTLTYDSAVGADTFVIGDGTVRLKTEAVRAAKAGLVEGVDYYARAVQTEAVNNVYAGKVATAYAIQPNLRAMTSNHRLDIRCPEGYEANDNLRFSNISYSGYLWNRGETDKTVTIACYLGEATCLWIGDELVVEQEWGSKNAVKKTIVLTPGAHRILSVNYAKTGDGGIHYGNPTNFPWYGMGLQYDPQGRDATNHEYYVKMEDPGDGSLFTWALPEEDAAHPLDPSVTVRGMPEFETLVFSGTSGALDVSGYAFEVENVEGVPVVQNGGEAFTITGKWTLHAEDILAGRKAAGLPLAFGADAEFELVDPRSLRSGIVAKGGRWLIAESTDAIPGGLSVKDSAHARNWQVSIEENKVYLEYVPTGTVMIVR